MSDDSKTQSTRAVGHLPYSDEKRWYCIYPIYLNRDKKLIQGRRVPKSIAIENPTVYDIIDVCRMKLSLPCKLEDKAYSRDFYQRGRVRVQLKQGNGNLLNSEINNRKTLLMKLCKLIPDLPNREKYKQIDLKYQQSLEIDPTLFMTKEEKKEYGRQNDPTKAILPIQSTAGPNKKKKKGRK